VTTPPTNWTRLAVSHPAPSDGLKPVPNREADTVEFVLTYLRRWLRLDSRPTRAELIDHKHRLQAEIDQLNRRVRAEGARGNDVGALQARLERLRGEHIETRLRIDRTP
jgi:hypothetical protein